MCWRFELDDQQHWQARSYRVALGAVRLSRREIFGDAEDQLPIAEPADAQLPQIGFIGSGYRRGGTVLLGINPGGGGDAYRRPPEDARLLPMISALREGEPSLGEVQALFDHVAVTMRRWNLWRIVAPVLDACGESQEKIAYLNWCPFRTRQDKMPRAGAMQRCLDTYLHPFMAELAPARIIALGKKVGAPLQRVRFGDADRVVIPRTIGDSYLSQDALIALEELRQGS